MFIGSGPTTRAFTSHTIESDTMKTKRFSASHSLSCFTFATGLVLLRACGETCNRFFGRSQRLAALAIGATCGAVSIVGCGSDTDPIVTSTATGQSGASSGASGSGGAMSSSGQGSAMVSSTAASSSSSASVTVSSGGSPQWVSTSCLSAKNYNGVVNGSTEWLCSPQCALLRRPIALL